MDWTSIAVTAALVFGVPYGLILAQQVVNARVKDERMRQWATGAISAAGKAYTTLMALRQAQPATPLLTLIDTAVKHEANTLMANYSQTAAAIGATLPDAQSRVRGELGALLAADPTVTVAPAEAPPRNPPTPSVPLRNS